MDELIGKKDCALAVSGRSVNRMKAGRFEVHGGLVPVDCCLNLATPQVKVHLTSLAHGTHKPLLPEVHSVRSRRPSTLERRASEV